MQNHEDLNGKFEAKVDATETLLVLEKLENFEDEELAVKYLKALNDKNSALGKFVMNRDQSIDHGTWKLQCDEMQNEINALVSEIMSH